MSTTNDAPREVQETLTPDETPEWSPYDPPGEADLPGSSPAPAHPTGEVEEVADVIDNGVWKLVQPDETGLGWTLMQFLKQSDCWRYCPELDHWLKWDKKCWKADPKKAAISQFVEYLLCQLEDTGYFQLERHYMSGDMSPDEVKKVTKESWGLYMKVIKKVKTIVGIRRMVEWLQTFPSLQVTIDELDPAHLIPFQDQVGVVDFEAGTLTWREHHPGDMNTGVIPFDFDPEAENEELDAFLEKVQPPELFTGDTPEDQRKSRDEYVAYLFRALGYSLTGSSSEEKFFTLIGETAANGKTTLLELAVESVGPTYGSYMSSRELINRRSDRHAAGIAVLQGKRLVVTSDPGKGTLDESTVKEIASSTTVSADRKHKDPLNFPRSFKVWIATNHRLRINTTDSGTWRRMVPFDFKVSIPDAEQDTTLKARLKREAGQAMLRKMVDGLQEYLERGLSVEPPEVIEARGEWKEDSNPVIAFLREVTDQDQPRETWSPMSATKIYGIAREWYESQGRGNFIPALSEFGKLLREVGLEDKRTKHGVEYVFPPIRAEWLSDQGDPRVPRRLRSVS